MNNVKKISAILLTSAIMTTAIPVNALTKNETVYSKLNADGSVKKTVVSEYLKNTDETINDVTNLKNILNLNGTEKYKLEGTNLVWDAKGKDIYYQGETEEQLPVSLEITYQLDGKDIKLDDLLGKKGNVTINLKYTNSDSHVVNVNGTNTKLYTPFVVTTGTIISNENNSNITVTNGKVISNGKNSFVVGVTSPGLYESLDAESLKNFDTVTINFDTTKFELSSIYSAVSSKLISNDDLKVFNKLDGIYSKVDTLSNSSKQLVEGSNKLYNGTLKLQAGLNSSINSTAKTLTEEQKNTILNSALTTLQSKFTDEYKDAIGQKAIQDLNKTPEMSAQIAALNAVGNQVVIKGTDTEDGTTTEDDTTFDQLATICTSGNIPAALATACAGKKAEITQYLTSKALIEKMQKIAYSTAVKTAETTATTTVKELVPTLSETVATETKNTTLKTINNNISTLVDGTKTLADGISKFDSEGISKVANLVNGDVKTTEGKVKALIKLGDAYDSFTMKSDNTEGETKFVLVVDGAKKVEKTTTKKATKPAKKSVFDKIKDIF